MISGSLLQEFTGQIGQPAQPIGSVSELGRPLLCELDQFGQGFYAEPRCCGYKHRSAGQIADRCKVLRHLDWQTVGPAGRRDEGGKGDYSQSIAIGCRSGCGVHGDGAIGTGLVNDYGFLAPHVAEAIRNNARGDIDRASGS